MFCLLELGVSFRARRNGALRLRGDWSGSRGRRRSCAEIDFGGLAGAGFGFEVGVVASEAAEAGDQAVGEKRDVGVVVLNGFVVAAALDSDAVFRSSQLVLEAEKVFVGFEQ